MRNNGRANSLVAILLIGLLALMLLMGIGLMGRAKSGNKKVVALSAAADTAWAEVEKALTPRYDLVPGLVEVARGYATNDQDLFTRVTDARAKYLVAAGTGAEVEAANRLEGLLTQLLALQDQSPQLRGNETFRALNVALAATDPAVATARNQYNDTARALNDYLSTPFGLRLAQKSNIHPRPYFQPPASTGHQGLLSE